MGSILVTWMLFSETVILLVLVRTDINQHKHEQFMNTGQKNDRRENSKEENKNRTHTNQKIKMNRDIKTLKKNKEEKTVEDKI